VDDGVCDDLRQRELSTVDIGINQAVGLDGGAQLSTRRADIPSMGRLAET
jgi:hypothetical protein